MNDRFENPSQRRMSDGNGLLYSQLAQRKRNRMIKNGLLGIGAELLFACGFILIGFLISMLAGW